MAKGINVPITGDASRYIRELRKAQGATGKFGAVVKTALVSGGLAAAAGLGVAATASVKMALDFETSMTKIRALVGASDKQMEEYKQGVLSLAETVPQGPQALADALYFVTSAGFKGKQALDVLTASAQAAAAGLGDTATVADAVTSAVNAYGIEALKAGTATDILLATVREGKAEPEELAASIGRVIAPAQALGVSFGEVGGAVAALSLTGLDAAEAVTGLRGILSSTLKPSKDAAKFLESVGLSAEEIRKQIADKGLLRTLQSLRDRFGDNKEALAQLFPNVRALNAFLSLTGKNAEKNALVMRRVESATGDTAKAFKTASESAKFQLDTAWSKIQVVMIKFGSVTLPLIVKALQHLGPVMATADKYVNQLKQGWARLGAIMQRHQGTVNNLAVGLGILARAVGLLVRWNLFLYRTFIRVELKALDFALTLTGKVIGAFQAVIGVAKSFGGQVAGAFRPVISAAQTLYNWINAIISAIGRLISAIQSIPSLPSLPGGGGLISRLRQHGGPVRSGMPYTVGERGPELFVPTGGGRIIPNGRGGGMGGEVRVIVVGGDAQAIRYFNGLFGRDSKRNG